MNTPVLNDNLRAATEALCNLLAKEDKVVNQISHRHLSGGVVDAVCQIAPQFFLFFPQLCQGFSVNTTPFLVDIGITIVVGAVCSLAFAILQNTTLAIFALFRYLETPFCEKRI